LQLKKVRGFLSQSPVPISQIALATGFISQVHFPIVSEVNIANLPRHSYKVGGRDCFTNAVNLSLAQSEVSCLLAHSIAAVTT